MNDGKLVHWLNIAIAIVALVTVIAAAAVFIGDACRWRHLERADNPAPDAGTGTITGTVMCSDIVYPQPPIGWMQLIYEKEGDK